MKFVNRRRLKKQQEKEDARIRAMISQMGYVKQSDLDDKDKERKRKALWDSLSRREQLMVLRYVAKKKGVDNE